MDLNWAMVFMWAGACVSALGVVISFTELRRALRARHSLVVRLSQDPAFVEELKRLQTLSADDPHYPAELQRIRKLIGKHFKEFAPPEVELLASPMRQPSRSGRLRYIASIAYDVERRLAHAA